MNYVESLYNDIDNCYRDMTYYSTAFGGDPDDVRIEECNHNIRELQQKINLIEGES